MADDIVIYHPPKKEPSIFNYYGFVGAIACASSPVGAALGAVIGGLIGYYEDKHNQEYGIKAKKPDGSILNGNALIGAAVFGLGATAFVGAASALAATAIIGASAAAGGLLLGWAGNKANDAVYNLALKQEKEREAAIISKAQSVGQYKNIPDLPQQTQDKEPDGKFQESEKKRQSTVTIPPFAISGGR